MTATMNFAAAAGEKKAEDTPLRIVQLDGHVILKIVKHCKEGMPTLVTGQLLGLDVGQTLEVTDCFPFPVQLSIFALPWSMQEVQSTYLALFSCTVHEITSGFVAEPKRRG
jgi:hypothetical protein